MSDEAFRVLRPSEPKTVWLLEKVESPSDHWPLGVFSSLEKAKDHAEKRCIKDGIDPVETPWEENEWGDWTLRNREANYFVSEEDLDPEVG